jgi:integrase
MPRRPIDARIETKADRARLAARNAPYWRTIKEGESIGYRSAGAKKAGSWQARHLGHGEDGARIRKFKSLGGADDLNPPDGTNALSFAQAHQAAVKWFAEIRRAKGAALAPLSVADAMTAYVADYRARGGKDPKGLDNTIAAHITPKLGGKEVASLTAGTIRTWHRALATAAPRRRTSAKPGKNKAAPKPVAADDTEGQRARRATANRVLTVLKAGLNLAYGDGKVASDDAWRRVSPFKQADAPRIRDFSDAEAKRLVNASGETFRPMIQAALLTGARYGELVRLRAADFNAATAMLHIRPGKTGKARDVALTDEAVKFFKVQAAGKSGNALMLTQPGGEAWGKSHQFRPMRAACKAASIMPAIGFHILRHAYASRLAMAGVPLGAVAAQLGNSEAICARHYAHHSPNSVGDAVRKSSPALGIVPESNVVSMGRG